MSLAGVGSIAGAVGVGVGAETGGDFVIVTLGADLWGASAATVPTRSSFTEDVLPCELALGRGSAGDGVLVSVLGRLELGGGSRLGLVEAAVEGLDFTAVAVALVLGASWRASGRRCNHDWWIIIM